MQAKNTNAYAHVLDSLFISKTALMAIPRRQALAW